MLSPFHIFKVHRDGSRTWMEGAVSVEHAKARVKLFTGSSANKYVITNLTGQEISVKSPKRVVFQIGYDEKELNARAELFRRVGHEVMSVADNDAAKSALASIDHIDVFVVGHTASEQTRKEMVDWLKANFPKVKVVALIPFASRQVVRADYNILLNDWDALQSLLAATAG